MKRHSDRKKTIERPPAELVWFMRHIGYLHLYFILSILTRGMCRNTIGRSERK